VRDDCREERLRVLRRQRVGAHGERVASHIVIAPARTAPSNGSGRSNPARRPDGGARPPAARIIKRYAPLGCPAGREMHSPRASRNGSACATIRTVAP
jgi:hypothetical protein